MGFNGLTVNLLRALMGCLKTRSYSLPCFVLDIVVIPPYSLQSHSFIMLFYQVGNGFDPYPGLDSISAHELERPLFCSIDNDNACFVVRAEPAVWLHSHFHTALVHI